MLQRTANLPVSTVHRPASRRDRGHVRRVTLPTIGHSDSLSQVGLARTRLPLDDRHQPCPLDRWQERIGDPVHADAIFPSRDHQRRSLMASQLRPEDALIPTKHTRHPHPLRFDHEQAIPVITLRRFRGSRCRFPATLGATLAHEGARHAESALVAAGAQAPRVPGVGTRAVPGARCASEPADRMERPRCCSRR